MGPGLSVLFSHNRPLIFERCDLYVEKDRPSAAFDRRISRQSIHSPRQVLYGSPICRLPVEALHPLFLGVHSVSPPDGFPRFYSPRHWFPADKSPPPVENSKAYSPTIARRSLRLHPVARNWRGRRRGLVTGILITFSWQRSLLRRNAGGSARPTIGISGSGALGETVMIRSKTFWIEWRQGMTVLRTIIP